MSGDWDSMDSCRGVMPNSKVCALLPERQSPLTMRLLQSSTIVHRKMSHHLCARGPWEASGAVATLPPLPEQQNGDADLWSPYMQSPSTQGSFQAVLRAPQSILRPYRCARQLPDLPLKVLVLKLWYSRLRKPAAVHVFTFVASVLRVCFETRIRWVPCVLPSDRIRASARAS